MVFLDRPFDLNMTLGRIISCASLFVGAYVVPTNSSCADVVKHNYYTNVTVGEVVGDCMKIGGPYFFGNITFCMPVRTANSSNANYTEVDFAYQNSDGKLLSLNDTDYYQVTANDTRYCMTIFDNSDYGVYCPIMRMDLTLDFTPVYTNVTSNASNETVVTPICSSTIQLIDFNITDSGYRVQDWLIDYPLSSLTGYTLYIANFSKILTDLYLDWTNITTVQDALLDAAPSVTSATLQTTYDYTTMDFYINAILLNFGEVPFSPGFASNAVSALVGMAGSVAVTLATAALLF